MLNKIRNHRLTKFVSVLLSLLFITEFLTPLRAFALTSGPSQPEVQSFAPIDATNMVDLFSGDFSYNIPLLDIEGYPINLTYNSNITMDQEASWVGLGWNLNPGAITRNMRGIPDDFDGENISITTNIKKNETLGYKAGLGAEAGGALEAGISAGIGVSYNNYTGFGVEQMYNFHALAGDKSCGSHLNFGVNLTLMSSNSGGLDFQPSINLGLRNRNLDNLINGVKLSLGTSYNSRAGIKTFNFGFGHYSNRIGNSPSIVKDFDYGFSTNIPSPEIAMKNFAISGSIKEGGTIYTIDVTDDQKFFYSKSELKNHQKSYKSFGYLFSESGANLEDALHDFNREKDGVMSQYRPSLPVTNYTHDVYSVSAHGTGGSFRPYRSDFGMLYDPKVKCETDEDNVGIELGFGGLLKIGGDINTTEATEESGQWYKNNDIESIIRFTGGGAEKVFFKSGDDQQIMNNVDFYNTIGRNKAVRFTPMQIAKENHLKGGLENRYENFYSNLDFSNYYRSEKEARAKMFSYLSIGEMPLNSVNPDLYYSFIQGKERSPNQIGEITIRETDGSRYVFGLPVFNNEYKEVTFNASGLEIDNGMVTYGIGDNSINNNRGKDNYYNSKELPAYSYAHLLTAILSPDFVDMTNNGPTSDDLGVYTKFNYTLFSGNFKWRIPFEENKAYVDEGLYSIGDDNMASYIYGTKEIYNLESIESKNYKAIFRTRSAGRDDNIESNGENGGIGTQHQSLLYRIDLYSKNDLSNPIKSVHFRYASDFDRTLDLCNGTPNNSQNGGKLTLVQMWFTYGNSTRGALSKYSFKYNYNPTYSTQSNDRWGNYRLSGNNLSNSEFPYVYQNQKNQNDLSSSAWAMDEIILPTGGRIKINYEADDYAYVQDKPAMQMYKLTGTNDDGNPTNTETLNKDSKFYFKLPDEDQVLFSNAVGQESILFKQNYLKGIDKLYFRTNIKSNFSGFNNGFDYISGYADIDLANSNVINVDGVWYGSIKLIPVEIGKSIPTNINPLSKAALQFARVHTPKEAFNEFVAITGLNGGSFSYEFISGLFNSDMISSLIEAFLGPELYLYNLNLGKYLNPEKTWLRLNCGIKKKQGGGSRVKSVELIDNWDAMTSLERATSYGKEYKYEKFDEDGIRKISSGIASYEPMIGADENPFRVPDYFSSSEEDLLLAPDDQFYLEEPYGESFFPKAVVGYSNVIIKDIYNNVDNSKYKAGYTQYEFYTAKDFPTITKRTDMLPIPVKDNKWGILESSKDVSLSNFQGFLVEQNNMHGKLKSIRVFGENSADVISETFYLYKTECDYNEINSNKLCNHVNVLNQNGVLETRILGVDYDIISDTRFSEYQQNLKTLMANGYLIPLFGWPIPVPIPIKTKTTNHIRYNAATLTKVVNRTGILEKVIHRDDKSYSVLTNIAYDKTNGNVLLTSTTDEFNKSIFNLNIPAHWAYPRMEPAWKNEGMCFGVQFNGTNQVMEIPAGLVNYISIGDELIVLEKDRGLLKSKVLITSYDKSTRMASFDCFKNVSPYNYFDPTKTYVVKVLKSGRNNMIMSNILSIVTLKSPIVNNQLDNDIISQYTLNASAFDYSDNWDIGLNETTYNLSPENPYVRWKNAFNIWFIKPKTNYIYQIDRLTNTTIEKNGVFSSFSPYWVYNSSLDSYSKHANSNWKLVERITQYNANGKPNESCNILNNFSSIQFGYNNSLPIGVGSNSRLENLGFDGFEDYSSIYELYNYNTRHFKAANRVYPNNVGKWPENSHSGSYSIKIN